MPSQKVRGSLTVTKTASITGDVAIGGNLTVTGTVTPGAGNEFADNTFAVKDNGDATKKGAFECSGVTAGQKRVLTFPDYNGTIATLAGTETFTNKTLTSPKVGTAIKDTNGNEIIKTPATADAVNEFTATNAATGTSPKLAVTGDDANISMLLETKGTGRIVPSVGGFVQFYTVTSKAEASDQTYTAAQLLGGMILRDCNGAHRADTLPTAELLVAAVPGAVVGTGFEFTVQNFSNAAETITVGVGAGGTADPTSTLTIAQSNTKRFLVVFTNVTAAAEAYTLYSLGTVTH